MDAGVLAELCARWQAVTCRRLDRPAMARSQVSLLGHAANTQMPCNAVHCRAVPCRAKQCHAMPCNAVHCHAVCNAMPCARAYGTVTATVVCAVRSQRVCGWHARLDRLPALGPRGDRRHAVQQAAAGARTRTLKHARTHSHSHAHERTQAWARTDARTHARTHVHSMARARTARRAVRHRPAGCEEYSSMRAIGMIPRPRAYVLLVLPFDLVDACLSCMCGRAQVQFWNEARTRPKPPPTLAPSA